MNHFIHRLVQGARWLWMLITTPPDDPPDDQ